MVQMIKNKKGILITTMTLIILSAIFAVAMSYSERSDDRKDMFANEIARLKLTRVKNDIAYDYLKIIRSEINSIVSDDRHASINISFLLDKKLQDPYRLLDEYSSYMQHIYGEKTNIDIILSNKTYMKILPYDTTIEYNTTRIFFNFSKDMPKNISLVIYTGNSIYLQPPSSFEYEPGETELIAHFYDAEKNHLNSIKQEIDIAAKNMQVIEFNNTMPFSAIIMNITNDMMEIKLQDEINASIMVTLGYDASDKNKIYLKALPNTFIDTGLGIRMNTSVILAEG